MDKKDEAILKVLCENARTPDTIIAKRVGLSADAVRYRKQQYEKDGIILGYKTQIHIGSFGYQILHVLLSCKSKESKDKICEFAVSHKQVRAVWTFAGMFDLQLAVIGKTQESIMAFLLQKEISTHIHRYEILHIIAPIVYKTLPFETSAKLTQVNTVFMDAIDKKLLNILANNATISYVALSEKVGMSAETILRRVKRMVTAKLISRFVPEVHYPALSYHIFGLFWKSQENLENVLLSIPQIIWAVKCIGHYNYLAYICVSDVNDIGNILLQLKTESTTDFDVHVALIRKKYTFIPDEI